MFLRVLTIASLTAAFMACIGAAEQAELHLQSGEVVKGEVISEGAEQVTLKIVFVGKSGSIIANKSYKRGDITEVVRLPDPEDEYAQRSKAATTAAAHAELATWCREQAMNDRAVAEAKLAVEQDANQASAIALLTELGWVQDGGKWVKEADWLAGQGKIRYRGKIMTIAEADALKAEEKEKAKLQSAQKAVDDATAKIASLDHQIADLAKRPGQIDDELAKEHAALATAQGRALKLSAAKTANDAAYTRLTQAQATAKATAPPSGGRIGNNNNANTDNSVQAAQQAFDLTQKAYNDTKRDASSAEQEAVQRQSRIAQLTAEKANVDKKRADLEQRRATAATELQTAQTALAAEQASKKSAAPADPAAPAK